MPLRLSTSHAPLLLVTLFVLAGCGNPHRDQGLSHLGGGGTGFKLKEPRRIDGQDLPRGTDVYGIRVNGEWIEQPKYAHTFRWSDDFAYVRHHGQTTYHRYDIPTGAETPTPFTSLMQLPLDDSQVRHVVYGVIGTRPTVTFGFLSQDGRSWKLAERCKPPGYERAGFDPLGAGAMLLTHLDDNGGEYRRIYNPAGVAISPPLIGVATFKHSHGNRIRINAIPVDPARPGLFWPILPDGTIYPKPDDVVGVRPALVYERNWYGWIVVWRTPEGEREAYALRATDIPGILATREHALWLGLEREAYEAGHGGETAWLVHAPDTPGWVVRDKEPTGRQLGHGTFRTVDEARRHLRLHSRVLGWEKHEEQRMREEKWRAAAEERARAQHQERERRMAEQNAGMKRVDELLAAKQYGEAIRQARRFAPWKLADVVLAAQAGGHFVFDSDLIAAREHATESQKQLINARLPQVQESAWFAKPETYTGGNFGFSTTPNFTPNTPAGGSGGSAQSIIDASRWQSQLNYLSGQQSWRFTNSGQVAK